MGTMAGVGLALRVVAFGRQPFGHCKPVAGRSQWAFSLASAILIEMDDMNTVKCPLCRVDVPIDKIDLPNRCLHPQCPLKRPGARSLQSLSTPWAVISPRAGSPGAFIGPLAVILVTAAGAAPALMMQCLELRPN